MTNEEKRMVILAKVAYRYYIEDKNQQDIADELNLTRPSISRFLVEAKSKGIIKFDIQYPWRISSIEQEFKNRFNLKDVVIIEPSSYDINTIFTDVAYASSSYLTNLLPNIKTIGVSWGAVFSKIIENLDASKSSVKEVVQIMGAAASDNLKYGCPWVVQALSDKLQVPCTMIHAPIIVENESVCKSLLYDKNIKNTLEKSMTLDLIVVAIGCCKKEHNRLLKSGYLNENDVKMVNNASAVGDICARYYDINGNLVPLDIGKRTIAIELDSLKKIKTTIGIASDVSRAEAIYGAINGQYINVLITDTTAAEAVLKLDDLKNK